MVWISRHRFKNRQSRFQELGEKGAAGKIGFAQDTDGNLASRLHEEQGGAYLPGHLQARLQDNLIPGQRKMPLVDQGGQVSLAMGEQVLVEGFVVGEQAAAEEQAAIVAPAGKHGGRTGWKILPAGMRGDFPKDGIEERQRGGGRATPPPAPSASRSTLRSGQAPPQIPPLRGHVRIWGGEFTILECPIIIQSWDRARMTGGWKQRGEDLALMGGKEKMRKIRQGGGRICRGGREI